MSDTGDLAKEGGRDKVREITFLGCMEGPLPPPVLLKFSLFSFLRRSFKNNMTTNKKDYDLSRHNRSINREKILNAHKRYLIIVR